jgi:hypothetical protein
MDHPAQKFSVMVFYRNGLAPELTLFAKTASSFFVRKNSVIVPLNRRQRNCSIVANSFHNISLDVSG